MSNNAGKFAWNQDSVNKLAHDAANEVRIVTSTPALAQMAEMVDAWTSDPPASASARSRHARRWTRRKPLCLTSSASSVCSEVDGKEPRCNARDDFVD